MTTFMARAAPGLQASPPKLPRTGNTQDLASYKNCLRGLGIRLEVSVISWLASSCIYEAKVLPS